MASPTSLAGPPNARKRRRIAELLARGQPGLALQLVQDALAKAPGDADLLGLAGRCARALGDDANAEQWLQAALAAGNADPRALSDLGALLTLRGRHLEAEALLGLATERHPQDALLAQQLGVLLLEGRRSDHAEPWFRRALTSDPGLGPAHFNLGLLLAHRNAFAEAENCLRKAFKCMPRLSAAPYNLATLLARQGRLDEAEGFYRKAIQLAPKDVAAHYSLAALLKLLGREDQAEQSFGRALTLQPDFARAALDLALLLLRQGRYRDGWPLFESRYAPTLPNRAANAPALEYPQWRGEDLRGRSILVICDQGFGDQIQFCRFLAELKERGAARVTLVAPPVLAPLLGTARGIDRLLLDHDRRVLTERHDYWTFLLSLPFRLALDPSYIGKLPYLQVFPDHLKAWADRVPAAELRVGLVWKGSALHINDADRSLPGLATLAPLWEVPGVRFFSLQKGSGETEAEQSPASLALTPLGRDIADFADVAAAVSVLDLIVCVDTAVAHVAGALDKPAWVLLPRHDTDWRWGRDDEQAVWYASLRLFRQKARGDWSEVVAEVGAALRELVQDWRRRRAS